MNRNSSPKSVCLGELSTGRRLARRLRSWSRGRYRPNDEQDDDIPIRGVSRLDVWGSDEKIEDGVSEADSMSEAEIRYLIRKFENLQKQMLKDREAANIREKRFMKMLDRVQNGRRSESFLSKQ